MPMTRATRAKGLRAMTLAGALATMGLVVLGCAPEQYYPPATTTTTTAPTCSPNIVAQPNNPPNLPSAGWWTSDTRSNGSVAINDTMGAPAGFGCGAAVLATGEATGSPLQDKAQLYSFAAYGTPLSAVNTISYWAKKSSSSTGGPAIDLAMNVQIGGAEVPGNFATLVYEPYNQSGGQNAIALDTWQQWNATDTSSGNGLWWTNKIPSGPGSQAQPIPWASFQALYPTAVVGGYGINIGSNNPNTTVAGDGVVFGAATADF